MNKTYCCKEGIRLRTEVEKRAIEPGVYIVQSGATVRSAAKRFGISKSMVHTTATKWNGSAGGWSDNALSHSQSHTKNEPPHSNREFRPLCGVRTIYDSLWISEKYLTDIFTIHLFVCKEYSSAMRLLRAVPPFRIQQNLLL